MKSDNNVKFESLDLIEPLLKALHSEGYTNPTPIQAQAIPHILKERDLLGCAQTGTGKTAAFSLPILQLLSQRPAVASTRNHIRCLILTPTRELAAQINESLTRYGSHLGLSSAVVFGGVGQGPQVTALRRGVDILVATPGRLLDLMEQKHVSLEKLEIFVLDEADRMLDMGFIHDVKRVIKVLPKQRQSLFFSATMPPDIQRLAATILSNPVQVEVTPVATTAEKIDQAVYFVDSPDAKRALLEHLLKDPAFRMTLVFTRTKHGADRVTRFLNAAGITAEAIHGNKSQNNRVRALDNFKRGDTRVLVATDIAARGIDIDGVSHVINFEMPNVPETYVHRIGRTARAGSEGSSLSFCDQEERAYLRDIERLIRQKIRVVEDHPFVPGTFVARSAPEARRPAPRQGGAQRSQARQQGRQRRDERTRAPQTQTTKSGSAPAHRSRDGGGGGVSVAKPARHSNPAARSESPPRGGPRRDDSTRAHSHNRPQQSPARGGAKSSSAPRAASVPGHAGRSSGASARSGASSRSETSPAGGKKPWWKRLVGGK